MREVTSLSFDKRQDLTFPKKPKTKSDIWNYDGRGFMLACALVDRYDDYQFNTYQMLWRKMDESSFRCVLERVLAILSRPNNIRNPAAFLAQELKNATL